MKITFITFHNWETKRIGGFHKFAEACANAGHKVIFFSFARPYYSYIKQDERQNKHVLETLSKGVLYKTNKGHDILNCTWPTLRIPNPIYRHVPRSINHWCNTHSLKSFSKFCSTFLDGTDVFVFESCEGIELFDMIRKKYPSAKYVYRPSDPMMIDTASKYTIEEETKVLKSVDLNIIVNQKSVDLYKRKVSDYESTVNYCLLSNGVDIDLFTIEHPVPDILKKDNTALYVGAREAEWDLLVETAKMCPDYNIICVCPEKPSASFLNCGLKNLFYIPGISPNEVPAYVTNCDVIIVPNPAGEYKLRPWGVTAKYYQAFAANKPVVAFDDIEELTEYGAHVSHSYNQFIKDLRLAMENRSATQYELSNKSWTDITAKFISLIENL